MRRLPNLILIIFLLCSCVSFLFYWLLYLEAEEIDKKDVDKEIALNLKLDKRLSDLENGLKENQIVLNILNAKIRTYINKIKKNENSLVSSPRTDLCNFDKSEKSIPFNLTIEQLYEILPFDDKDGGVWKQGFDVEINEDRFDENKPLKVFVVPHSHNDPGWLKTFDHYYKSETKLILNNMLKFLPEHQKMTFIWAEISYFSRWYDELKSEDSKEQVKTLLDSGQLEIVTGGYVMTDESNTHYFSMISQMIDGNEWLMYNLNYRPKNSWSIDPFGLSPTMAFILKRMGFKAMVIQRVHYAIKKYFAKNKFLEFNWKQHFEPNEYIENTKGILTHLMPFYSYDVPHTCGVDPKICCQFDFKRLPNSRLTCPWGIQPEPITDKNVEERANLLLDQYKKKAMLYKTNNLLVPLGDDFRYQSQSEWEQQYKNYIKIFDYINSKPELNTEIKFGTLNDYFENVLKEISVENSPTFAGNFFTYADKEDNYWSGYYISRPFYKRYDRILQYHLRSTEILFSFYSILNGGKNSQSSDLANDLTNCRNALALFQHHDGITGTARTHVVEDYAERMYSAIKSSEKIISTLSSLLFYLPMTSLEPPIKFIDHFPQNDIPTESALKLTNENDYWSLFLYNTLAKQRDEMICFKIIANENWILRDQKGKLVNEVQINQLSKLINSRNEDEACFKANLKPVSINQYSIELNSMRPNYEQSKIIEGNLFDLVKSKDFDFKIQSDKIQLEFDTQTGLLTRYIDLELNEVYQIEIKFLTYGTRRFKSKERSGAYLFLPDNERPNELKINDIKMQIIKGNLVTKVITILNAGFIIRHEITLTNGEPYFDIKNQFHLGIKSFSNKELLMRLKTDIKNENVFYTDLNGFQMAKRQYFKKIPLQGNVYPMPTASYIEDLKSRINFFTGQPLAMTSSSNTIIDVFLDRVLLQDDLRGLGQGITDNKPTTEIYRVFIEKTANESAKLTLNSQLIIDRLLNPVIKMKSTSQSSQGLIEFFKNELPCDVHLLNLRTNLNTFNDFNLFLHRYLTSCETKCFNSETLHLNDILRTNLLNVLDEKAEILTLNTIQKLSELNILKEDFFIQENDFKVFGLKLKQ